MGSIYQRGKVYWIKYYRDGKPYRESTGSARQRDATKLLKQREGAIACGTFTGLERATFDDLAADLLNDYGNNCRKAKPMVEYYVKRLRKRFGGRKAAHITTDMIRAYVAARKKEPTHMGGAPANATINRELAALKRMFNLGRETGKLATVPHIPMLKENNVRKGFFTVRDYLRLKTALRCYLKPLVTLAHFTGMRREEMLQLTWDQVDFHEGTIRLDPGTTKNDEARIVPLSQELHRELSAQRKLRDQRFPFCQHVFFNHSTGRQIRDFRGAWYSARKKVGLPDALFHDFRRTGVRNLIRAGVPEKVAMAISGHKTRSIFDRYNIVSEDDVRAAARAVESYLQDSTGTIWAQIAEIDEKRAKKKTG